MNRTLLANLFFLPAVLMTCPPAASQDTALTVEALKEQGRMPLSQAALESFVVGKTLIIKNLTDGAVHDVIFFGDGYRVLHTPIKVPGTPGTGREGVATYEITEERLVTRIGASVCDGRVYEADGRYLAADEKGGGAVDWEVFPQAGVPIQPTLTAIALEQAGIMPLADGALRRLIVGRTLDLRERDTGERYRAVFRDDGMREIRNLKTGAVDKPRTYEIAGGGFNTFLENRGYRARVYRVDDSYLVARSSDGGTVKWQLLRSR